MDIGEMKRIAEREIDRYREHAAFVRGWIDGGGGGNIAQFRERQRWVWAVERVRMLLEVSEPDKATFFAQYYLLDEPHGRRRERQSMTKLSLELHVSETTLFRWRNEILLSVAVAAVQSQALRPF